ncbi:MAG: hypothetical protein SGI74_04755 [Oligoflexia bacterium]|nr:hypothetical protein [Oligoflexia bacterium]
MKIIIYLSLILFASNALAYSTNYLMLPNNETLTAQKWRIDTRSHFNVDKRYSDTQAIPPSTSLGATYGIFDNQELSVEAGLDWFEPTTQDNLNALRTHGKFLVSQNASPISVAIGFYEYAFKTNANSPNILYLQFEKKWDLTGAFKIGYFSGNSEVMVNENFQASNKGIIAGWARPLPELINSLTLSAEWMGSQSYKGGALIGTSWKLQNATFKIGYFIPTNKRIIRDSIFAQLNVDL